MALVELVGSGNVKYTKLGGSAHAEFLAEWNEALWVTPTPGMSHPEFPLLRVANVEFVPEGPPEGLVAGVGTYSHRRCLVDYEFSYRDIPLGEEPRITHTGTCEVMNTCAGRRRDDTGGLIDMEDLTQATVYQNRVFNVDCAVAIDPEPYVGPICGCINDAEFYGYPAGTLLLTDYEVLYQYDYTTSAWYYRITYKILYRGYIEGVRRTHNEMYFPPVYERDDETGNIQYYQDTNPEMTKTYIPLSTPRDPRANTPIYMVGADAGIWTTTTPRNYAEADFSALPLRYV